MDSAGARNYVEFSATVKQVDALFGTQENRYSAKGTSFLANATPPSVPAHLDILDVVGLNTLEHPTTPLDRRPRACRRRDRRCSACSTAPASLPSIPGEGTLTGTIQNVLGSLPGSARG